MAPSIPPASPSRLCAPWTPQQVDALNAFQTTDGMHPLTCGSDRHSSVPLEASQDGWHCPVPGCGYTQNWALAFMADRTSWPTPVLTRPPAADIAYADADAIRRVESSGPKPTAVTRPGKVATTVPEHDDVWRAIESAIYEWREMTCLWGETDGVTEGLTDVVRRSVEPELNRLRHEAAEARQEQP